MIAELNGFGVVAAGTLQDYGGNIPGADYFSIAYGQGAGPRVSGIIGVNAAVEKNGGVRGAGLRREILRVQRERCEGQRCGDAGDREAHPGPSRPRKKHERFRSEGGFCTTNLLLPCLLQKADSSLRSE
jgi:hypothetical protein